jgi:hypothetical protein
MSLFALPGDHSITLKWDILPEEGKNFAGGYIINIDRSLGTYVTLNLSIIEAAKKCYVIDDLNNGTTYLVQYVQLFDDGTQMSTLSKGCTPQAPPLPVVLVNAAATPSSDKFTVTVTINNPNSPEFCNISFALIQVHEDSPSIANDDPNAVGGIYYGDDILNYNFPVNGNIYVLDNVPRAHYKLQATYIAPFGKSWSNMLDVFAYLTPSNVTVVATSGKNAKLPFTVSAADNTLAPIETIRVTVSLNGVIKEIIDLTNGNGWTKVGSNITGSGEFTGLINDTAYKVEAVGITADVPNSIGDDTDNMVSSTVGTTYGVPHNPTNAASTISFTPSNGIATTGYAITLTDSTITNYFEVVFKDITGQEVYRASNMTSNYSSIGAEYLFDGLKIYVTIKDPILSRLTEYWKYPELEESLYAHTELVSERLNIETTPDPVYQLQLSAHNVISFLAAWNANSQPDYFSITSDNFDFLGEERVVSTVMYVNQPSGSIIELPFYVFQEGTEYTLNVVATNSTASSTKESITFMYVTAPPVLSSATAAQVGYDLKVSLLGVVPTTSYWTNGRAFADVYVNGTLKNVGVSVDSTYYVTDLAYDDVVEVNFQHVAFYYKYEPLATRHNKALADEYSEALSRKVTITRHPATFSGLTWTQNSAKLDYGTLSWTPPVLASGAAVTYKYTVKKNGVSSADVSVSLGDSLSVQYLVEHTLTLTATVVYKGGTTTHSETITFTPVLPELTPVISYTKIDPGVGVPGDKEVSYSIALNNNYSYVSAKIKYSNDGVVYDIPNPSRFTITVPGVKIIMFKVVGSLTNGDFDDVQNETDWILESYIWGLPPSITLTSAERIVGGSKITYTVHCNGDYVTGLIIFAVPSITDFNTTSIAFTKNSFTWTDLFESAEFTQEFLYDIFPYDIADKDDIKLTMFVLNNSGLGQFEQNMCPEEQLPPPVDIIPSTLYNSSNRFISFTSTSTKLATPDHFSYYMIRTSDNAIVLESIVMNDKSTFNIDISDYVNLWSEYKFKVRAHNSAGVSDYESVTFTYGSPPTPVTGLNVVNTTVFFNSYWTLETAPAIFYIRVADQNGDVFKYQLQNQLTTSDTFAAAISGLVDGTSYTAYVQAQNNVGVSTDLVYPFVYFQGPNPVTNVSVVNKTVYFKTSWTLTKPDKVYVRVERDGVDVDSTHIVIDNTASSGMTVTWTLSTLVDGPYIVYVQAQTNRGGVSDIVKHPFTYVVGPDAVTNIEIDETILSFVAAWTTEKPSYFDVRVVGPDGTVFTTVKNVDTSASGDTFTVTMNGLVTGDTYIAYVQARNDEGGVSDIMQEGFTYYVDQGAIPKLDVINTTAFFTPYWTTTPDNFYYSVTGPDEIVADDGFISAPASSGVQVTKALSNLVSGTAYTLVVQPRKDSLATDEAVYQFTYFTPPPKVSVLTVTDYVFSFISTWLNVKPERFYWYINDSTYGFIDVASENSGDTFLYNFGSFFTNLVGTLGGTSYTLRVQAQSANGGRSDFETCPVIVGALPEKINTTTIQVVGEELSFVASWFEYAKISSVSWYMDSAKNGTVQIGTASSGSVFRFTLPALVINTTYTVRFQSTSTTGFTSDYVYSNPFKYGSAPDVVTNLKVVGKQITFNSSWRNHNIPTKFTWAASTNGNDINVGTSPSGSEFGATLTLGVGSYNLNVSAINAIGSTPLPSPFPFIIYAAPNRVYTKINNAMSYTLTVASSYRLAFYSEYTNTTTPSKFVISATSGTATTNSEVTTIPSSGSRFTTNLSLVVGNTYTGTVVAVNTGGSSASTPISSFRYGLIPIKPSYLEIIFSGTGAAMKATVRVIHGWSDWNKPTSIRVYLEFVGGVYRIVRDYTFTTILASGSTYETVFDSVGIANGDPYNLNATATNAIGTTDNLLVRFNWGTTSHSF